MIHSPVSSSGSEYTNENHWTRAQEYTLSQCVKEKNKKTRATSKLHAPSRSGCELTRTQSYRAAPFLHDEVARMCSRRIPLMLLRSLGALNIATAELKTD